MRTQSTRLAAVVGLVGALTALGPAPEPEIGRLKAHVATLASPEFEGRSGPGGLKAAEYLVAEFQKLGLEPLFAGSYLQEIPDPRTGQTRGRNVGARLVGSDPKLRDQWIIVSAHFDHLGIRNGILYPGADDNASGVAMMLEAARCFANSAERPGRSVMFLGFDLEEIGLFGSRYFIEHMPVPLDRVALFLTADLIGRSLAGLCPRQVFVIGSEHAPGLRPWVVEAAAGRPLEVGLLGADVLVIDRSDYGPFRLRKVPYLFFSTGENPCYHRPTDTPETLDYPKLEAISRLIFGVAHRASRAEAVPTWSEAPDHPLAEALTIREVLRTFLDHREELKIPPAQTFLMRGTLKTLDTVAGRGSITPEERASVLRVARIVLFTVL